MMTFFRRSLIGPQYGRSAMALALIITFTSPIATHADSMSSSQDAYAAAPDSEYALSIYFKSGFVEPGMVTGAGLRFDYRMSRYFHLGLDASAATIVPMVTFGNDYGDDYLATLTLMPKVALPIDVNDTIRFTPYLAGQAGLLIVSDEEDSSTTFLPPLRDRKRTTGLGMTVGALLGLSLEFDQSFSIFVEGGYASNRWWPSGQTNQYHQALVNAGASFLF